MKNIFYICLFLLAACEIYQEPAKVEYHIDKNSGSEIVQGPPKAGSKQANILRNKGMPVTITDISQDNDLLTTTPTVIESKAIPTQVYTVSDRVGPSALSNNHTSTLKPGSNDTKKIHVVQRGDTLFSIARLYDIPILPIIVKNRLEPPYSLQAGTKIRIPQGRFHRVSEGESLYSVSREYGVDMSGIVKLNDLKAPYNLVVGQRLQVPFPAELPKEEPAVEENKTYVASVSSSTSDNKSGPVSLRRPTGGILGEIRTDINGKIVSVGEPEESYPSTRTEDDDKTEYVEDDVLDIKPSDGKFMWPVKGKVVKKFGQQGNEYNDGINIAVSEGTKVKAANSGKVVYTGNSLKSYGNLVIIKHDNGLLSAYAHMNDVYVKNDQKIAKGQVVGTVGATGKVTSPQLYFAIRKGKDAKNPENYLK